MECLAHITRLGFALIFPFSLILTGSCRWTHAPLHCLPIVLDAYHLQGNLLRFEKCLLLQGRNLPEVEVDGQIFQAELFRL